MAGQTDPIVVVGAGTAGLACAVEAAGRGRRVLLLEKAGRPGGSLHVSGGHLSAGGTRRQRERGITDSPERHLADLRRIARDTLRDDLAELATRLAPPTVDWLEDNGFEFAPETPRLVYGHETYDTPRTYYGIAEARSILHVLERLVAPHLASGQVRLRLDTRAAGLVVDGDRALGVRLADGGRVRGAAVVLATGGYASAPDLFAELDGAPLVTGAAPTSTGDGLRMARRIGAAIAGKGTFLPTFGGMRSTDDPCRVTWANRPLLTTERPPWEVYVDHSGRRFVAEDCPSIDEKERALAGLRDLTFWTVFDARALAASSPMIVGWSPDDLRARAGVHPAVHSAESIADLASRSGIDGAGLQATVAGYNAAVDAGADPECGRTYLPARIERPPFFAVENHGVSLISFAGVDVDSHLRVRREDGTVLANLYGAGEILGAAATTGNAFGGGMLLTPALSFGRLLGRRLGRLGDEAP